MTATTAANERRRFEYGRHETFTIRHGWLGKGISYIQDDASAFADDEAAILDLGLGSRMVKSLRYWMEASGLAMQDACDTGRRRSRRLRPSRLADIIRLHDPHLEYPATWWFVHLHLARRPRSVWGWFFSDYRERNFDRAACVDAYRRHLRLHAVNEPSLSVAQRDIACLLAAYATPAAAEPQDPEDGTSSPLQDLGLVVRHADTGRFEKIRPLDDVPVEAFLACVGAAAADAGQESMSVTEMIGRGGGPGTVYGLDAESIEDLAMCAARDFGNRGVALDLLGAERRLRVPTGDMADWLEQHFIRIGDVA
ncbi:DUF4007 family protein [Blastochloris tepida]|uniref:DUF4007 domain-containing protein n=1 Tax=Blastochloris tepida TaxID=2233851 RepID=A0A348G466_9HYPH|nr:DUF4007 family protein [Blastochloris tepida]BBF94349.1 hypothetical protein BLTE_30340 [Blastochloris tepida]